MRVCNINELRMYVSVSVGMCVCIGLAGPGRRRGLASGRNLHSRAHPCDNLPDIFCVCAIPYVIVIAPTRDSHHCLLQCPG